METSKKRPVVVVVVAVVVGSKSAYQYPRAVESSSQQ
jgi:hypothetical protein